MSFLTYLPFVALKHYFVFRVKLMLLFPGKMCHHLLKCEISSSQKKLTTIFVKRKFK